MEIFDTLWEATGISCLLNSVKEKIGITTSEKKVYHAEEVKPVKYSYRPETLDQYIGQERAKELIKMNIEKIKTLKPVHFIISGTRGHGKTTLAFIIAKQLEFNMQTYIGWTFTLENLEDFLTKNEKSDNPMILFIDEIHNLPKEIAEFLYPLLEDFILPLGNIKVRPFIFMGATTDKNVLLKKFAPLVDRCGCSLNLEHYLPEDIKKILIQYNDKVYKKNITNEVYDLLSVNTRFNPRTSLAMFDDFLMCGDIHKVLNAHRIIKNSLTTDDILILKYLAEINKPIGAETLAIVIQQTRQDYLTLIEPFLLQQGYLSRTARGRIILEKGKQILEKIK